MSSIGPELPPHLLAGRKPSQNDEDSEEESGPSVGPSIDPAIGPSIGPSVGPSVGPQLPSTTTQPTSVSNEDNDDEDEDAYGPTLPPGFAPKPSASTGATAASKRVEGPARPTVGPTLPPGLSTRPNYDEDEDSDEGYGPMPLPAGLSLVQKDAATEFREKEEARRKALEEAAKPKKPQRDEWMLKPPTSSDLLSNLDPTKLTRGRRFAASSTPAPREQDSTLWTETPAERQQRLADEIAGKRRRAENAEPVDEDADLARAKRRRAEEEVRAGVEAYTARNRGAALVEQHTSSGKGDVVSDKPVGIWDHSRDMALGGRLMDDAQRAKIIKDSKSLGDRFGSGSRGSFL